MTSGVLPNQWDFITFGDFSIENNYQDSEVYQQTMNYTVVADKNKEVSATVSWSGLPYSNGPIIAYPCIWVGKQPNWGDYWINLKTTSSLEDLQELEVKHTILIDYQSKFFNVAFDLWITSVPNGNEDQVVAEVMVWLDARRRPPTFGEYHSKYHALHGKKKISAKIYTEVGSSGSRRWDYIAVIFDKPQLVGSTDLRRVLNSLVNKKLLKKRHYISGWMLGAELTGGVGRIHFNDVSYTFKKAE